jgi:tetratricopeptide (TPR) repeat protein
MPIARDVRLVPIALAFLAASASMAAASRPIQKAYEPIEAYGDSLAKATKPAVAHAWADSVGRAATARGDRASAAAVALWHGRRYADYEDDYDRALPYLARALAEGQALRDTFAIAKVHEHRGNGGQVAGHQEAAKADYAQGVRYARLGRLPVLEGMCHRGLGSIAKLEGRYDDARHELAAAVRLLPENSFEQIHARLLWGETLNRTGHPDEARERFEEVLAQGRAIKKRWLVAAAMQDLGIVAFEQGDMAEADRQWFQAAAHYDTMVTRNQINKAAPIGCRTNRAHALIELRRYDEAEALLDRQIDESALLDDPASRFACFAELGVIMRQTGRNDRAERLLRSARAGMAGVDAESEEGSTIHLAGLLRETGRLGEADDVVDSLLVPARRSHMTAVNVGCALMEKSAIQRTRGEWAAALRTAREGERITRVTGKEPSIYWLDAVVELARCQRAAGRPDEAVATLAQASKAWEGWRAKISSLEWRERAGSGLSGLFAEYGLALLDPRRRTPEPARARQAFDALQVFQARTLEERMHGAGLAGRSMAARVTADSLRHGVLQPGEALLDYVSTPDTTFAFVVTRAGIVARLLPGATRLDALYRDWRDVMLGGADTRTVEQGLRRLSAELLAPIAASLAQAQRVIVSGGGSIALWPVGALTLPGESGPIGERREIASAPSATLFALLRARGPKAPGEGRMLALCRTTDAAGNDLPGAERELALLDRTYANVVVRRNPSVSEVTTGMGGYDALHFAAHAEASAATPWRSGFLLGKGTGDDAYLRASSVARLKLKARLAVLSGCQSAGATALAGEGALGLSSGFLSAGTTTVIATLWPVDDRSAELYMAAFYTSLAAGRPVAAAAREARNALRAEAGNPRDWAAFVVLGEPTTIFPLKARRRA